MIASRNSTIDVLLSQASPDREAADAVARHLAKHGMQVQVDRQIFSAGKNWDAPLRKALVESDVFLVVVDAAQPVAPTSTFELGAASTLGKRVYVVAFGEAGRLPTYLRRYPVYEHNSLDDLVRAIHKACEPLPERMRVSLVEVYRTMGIRADRLLADPLAIEQLGNLFRNRTGNTAANAKLAGELSRLMRVGDLNQMRPAKARS